MGGAYQAKERWVVYQAKERWATHQAN